jgi:hypothetical protein
MWWSARGLASAGICLGNVLVHQKPPMTRAHKLGYTVIFQQAIPPKNDRSTEILPTSPKLHGVEGHKKLGAKQNFQKIAKNC